MDEPTARIIAVADKGGVAGARGSAAGARGAGHHLTEGTTMEHTHEHAAPTRPAALMG